MATPFHRNSSWKPSGLTFRDDVEEARRHHQRKSCIKQQQQQAHHNDEGDTTEERPATEVAKESAGDGGGSRSLWHLVVAALLLGAAGTVLGIVNVLDDADTSAVSTAVVNGTPGGKDDDTNNPGSDFLISPTIDAIRIRGVLRCGLPFASTPGFAFRRTGGVYEGFDVDLCRALAAAVLDGNAEAYEVIQTSGSERWNFLASDQVDLVLRSTHTAERDVHEPSTATGFTFSTPYFYDGLTFGGIAPYSACAQNVDTTSPECQAMRVCVQGGTTHEAIVKGLFPEHHVVVPDQASLYHSFTAQACNVLANEGYNISPASLARHGYTADDYQLGDGNTTRFFSKEPLAIATRQDDPFWSDVVEWIIQTLMEAEERGVTRLTASTFPTTEVFGPALSDLFVNALTAVGNYGEIYDRHLQAMQPRDHMNRINTGETGLLYAFPWGDRQTVGPQIEITSPTVAAMKARGFLRCGVNVRKGFANFNTTTRSWSGFDVELCRAIAAAVFDGADDRVLYVDLPAAQRFQVLQEKRVDCLARLTTWTLARDVREPSTGKGLSFTAPYFYDGVTFGGIPPYLECAENQDVFSPQCQGLKFCTLEGTTGYNRVEEMYRDEYISPRLTFHEIIDSLNDGTCNAVAGGFQDVATENIRERGYLGPYEVGVKRYSKDPLAITTRQDDPVWSDFVRWVYWSLVYGQEEGIFQVNATLMPRTTLFGPLRTNSFYHAVNAVGNYGELYDRNFGNLISRGGVHSINRGDGPQMVSLPGF